MTKATKNKIFNSILTVGFFYKLCTWHWHIDVFFAPLWNLSMWEDGFTEYCCTAWWLLAGMTCSGTPSCTEGSPVLQLEQPSYYLLRGIQEILSSVLQVGGNESQAVSPCGVRNNLSKLITASSFLFRAHHRNATRGVALQFKQQLELFPNET